MGKSLHVCAINGFSDFPSPLLIFRVLISCAGLQPENSKIYIS